MIDLHSELETGNISFNHVGEELCGDHVEKRVDPDGTLTFVLADGLGSGVTANILSTLTATMLVNMIGGGLSIEESVTSLIKTLPASKHRGNVAYSTFTVIRVTPDFRFTIFNYDNPEPIFLRDGKYEQLLWQESQIEGKKILSTSGSLELHDQVLFMSDGAVYAGVGETLNFGWGRDEIISYAEGLYYPELTATNMASSIIEHCDTLYNHKEGDDTTVACVKRRERKTANLMVGPPTNPDDDQAVLSKFFALPGAHLVSGGTTSKVVSKYLGKPLEAQLDYLDPEIPPICMIEGVDLVTEGVITLNKVVLLAKDYLDKDLKYFDWCFRQDGASLLAKALFQDATDINFYVGCAVNPAHQDPKLGISISIKMQIVEELAKQLRLMGKHIRVSYF